MLAFIVVWLAIVVGTTFVMARLGHSWFTWAVLSMALGPLSWPLAIGAERAQRQLTPSVSPHPGDALVGVAPWARSPDAIRDCLVAAADRAHGATLVCVVDAEDATTPAGEAAWREAELDLLRCAEALEASGVVRGHVDCHLAFGRAADELARLAESGGYGVIVLGSCGSRAHHVLHGHVASQIRRRTSIPVVRGSRTAPVT
jgi:nucleotide-binding universal stress UspA family protein